MSEQERPNINAVGLLMDIFVSIERHLRGPAAQAELANRGTVFEALEDIIEEFCNEISDALDQKFGR